MNIDELIENFELLEDWEDKYRYLIDLGEKLPPLDPKYQTDDWKVSGCQSQVWLVPEVEGDPANKVLNFMGSSDAAIVRGVMSIIITIFAHKTAPQIKEIEVEKIFAKLGLEEHLSPSRRNGLSAMASKIKFYAATL